ncbi:hypothetical protein DMENIID0001_083740 [Sergentomyia squamirostris]
MSISKEKPPESSGTESPDDVVMDSSFENEIFRFAEEKVGIIPKKLKNVMSICGFTSSTTISSISTEDIENMEQYMRELDPTVAPPTKDLYGIYQKCPQKFKFGPGERALILKIKNSVSAAPRPSRAVESVSKVPSPPRTDVLAWKLKLENKIVQYMSHQDKVPSTAVVPGYKTEKTAIKKNGTGFSACVECPIKYCKKKIKLNTLKENRKNLRWVISNYSKHVLSHSSSRCTTSGEEIPCSAEPTQSFVTDYFRKK